LSSLHSPFLSISSLSLSSITPLQDSHSYHAVLNARCAASRSFRGSPFASRRMVFTSSGHLICCKMNRCILPQCGQGTKKERLTSADSYSRHIRPRSVVGVLACKTLRLRNVFVLSLAREIGSASSPEKAGYLSTSSKKRYRIGREARLDGEFAPERQTYEPAN